MQYPVTKTQSWWVLTIGGIVNILFGLAALFWPALTLFTLIWLFGIYAIIYGIVELVHALRAVGARESWWAYALVGIASIVAGILVFAWPGLTTALLAYVIAVWAIVIGLVEIVGAFTSGQLWLAVGGVISILFGFVMLSNPLAGALALVMVIGIFAIIRGIVLLVEAIRGPAPAPAR